MFFKKNKKEKIEKNRKKIDKISAEISEIWNGQDVKNQFDTDGSYTGNPDGFEVPVQDADDL